MGCLIEFGSLRETDTRFRLAFFLKHGRMSHFDPGQFKFLALFSIIRRGDKPTFLFLKEPVLIFEKLTLSQIYCYMYMTISATWC